ncbi:hypothetical protein [Spiroplasma citri]|uniref:hypothetical protein n=1 Tax=Spiroplasma citri TaxID=2133 RepID=UPI001EF7E509|nr:hypothetical protein [Spiroplasma citri]
MINTAKFVLFPKNYRQHQDYGELLLVVHKKFESIFNQGNYQPDYYNDPIWKKGK